MHLFILKNNKLNYIALPGLYFSLAYRFGKAFLNMANLDIYIWFSKGSLHNHRGIYFCQKQELLLLVALLKNLYWKTKSYANINIYLFPVIRLN